MSEPMKMTGLTGVIEGRPIVHIVIRPKALVYMAGGTTCGPKPQPMPRISSYGRIMAYGRD